MINRRLLSVALGTLLVLTALARGAFDLWALTAAAMIILLVSGAGILVTSFSSARGLRLTLSWFLLPLFAVGWLSFARSINHEESWLACMNWLLGVVLFLWAVNGTSNDADADLLPLMIAPLMIVELVMNALQAYNGHMGFHAVESHGSFSDANVAAGFVGPWLFVYLDKLQQAKNRNQRTVPLWAALVIMTAANLIFFSSTWSYLCLLTLLPFAWGLPRLEKFWKEQPARALAATLLLLALLVLIFWLKWTRQYAWGGPLPPRSNWSRFDWWTAALHMWKTRRWLGLGPGTFGSAYLAFKVGAGQHTLFPHNFWIGLLAETGTLGVAAFLFFLGAWSRLYVIQWSLTEKRWPYVLGAVFMMLHAAASFSFEVPSNFWLMWVFLGVALAPCVDGSLKLRPSVALVIAGVCLTLTPFLISPFLSSRNSVNGWLLLREGKLDEARKEFQSAAELDRRAVGPQRGLAAVAYQQSLAAPTPDSLGEAIFRQREAIRRNPMSAYLWWELGNFYDSAADREQARNAYQQAVRLHGSNARYQEALARVNAQR